MDESERIALTVEPAFSGMRLDAYLREQTPFSRSRIVSLMEEGAMVVNGEIERMIYPALAERCAPASFTDWIKILPV